MQTYFNYRKVKMQFQTSPNIRLLNSLPCVWSRATIVLMIDSKLAFTLSGCQWWLNCKVSLQVSRTFPIRSWGNHEDIVLMFSGRLRRNDIQHYVHKRSTDSNGCKTWKSTLTALTISCCLVPSQSPSWWPWWSLWLLCEFHPRSWNDAPVFDITR